MPELVMEPELAASGFVELKPYNHQVGGHCSFLHYNDTTLCKPLTSRERYFYETLPSDLKEFTPAYRGMIQVHVTEDDDGYVTLVGNPPKYKSLKRSPTHPHSPSSHLEVSSDTESENTKSLIRTCRQKQTERNGSFSIHLLRSASLDLPPRRNMPSNDSKKIVHTDDDDDDEEEDDEDDDEDDDEEDEDDEDEDQDLEENFACRVRQENIHRPWSVRCHKLQLNKLKTTGHTDCFKFILLENVAAKFRFPCVLDLKMGPRQHGDDHSEEKKQRKKLRCKESTSSSLGVRICGMKVYHVDKGQYVYQNKYHGRTLTIEGFKETLYKFLHNGLEARLDLIKPIIWRLQQLYSVVEKQDTFRFYTSSLLVMYDGSVESSSRHHHHCSPRLDNDSSDKCSYNLQHTRNKHWPEVEVRMIDFAHSTHQGFCEDKIIHYGPDKGYLFGLQNLISSFKEVLERYSPNHSQCQS